MVGAVAAAAGGAAAAEAAVEEEERRVGESIGVSWTATSSLPLPSPLSTSIV